MDEHIEIAILEALRVVGPERLWPVLLKEVSVDFVLFDVPLLEPATPDREVKNG